ncbi:MAG: hypothetical protein KDA41_20400 [Planctomycetales bacterium]|nr:hypothetical protein [Planctomycetales bacterium]
MLDREELIEQAHFFKTLIERLADNIPMQDLLGSIREEVLATTRLPMAIDFLRGELLHVGVMSSAMARLPHYFTPFQAYVMTEAESDRGRFDLRIGLQILAKEAEYRAAGGSLQGIFLYQFETLCRNRLRYDKGLDAIAGDDVYPADWREWLSGVRRQIGIIDLADMIYVRSEHYLAMRAKQGERDPQPEKPILFGSQEGKIALANRRKDPLLLFAALQRQLGYPAVPRPRPVEESPQLVPQLARRIERLEQRLKMMEEEQRSGSIDITKFYGKPPGAE